MVIEAIQTCSSVLHTVYPGVHAVYSALCITTAMCALCDIEKIMKIRKSEIKFRGSIRSGPMRKQEWGNGN